MPQNFVCFSYLMAVQLIFSVHQKPCWPYRNVPKSSNLYNVIIYYRFPFASQQGKRYRDQNERLSAHGMTSRAKQRPPWEVRLGTGWFTILLRLARPKTPHQLAYLRFHAIPLKLRPTIGLKESQLVTSLRFLYRSNAWVLNALVLKTKTFLKRSFREPGIQRQLEEICNTLTFFR